MKKRILPVLLALCMVMSLLPVTFAADTTTDKGKVSCADVPAANPTGVTTQEQGTFEGETVTVSVTRKVAVSGDNPHTGTCATRGCTCVSVSETAGDVTRSGAGTDESPYAYAQIITTTYTYGAMCDACKENTTCNPCTYGDCDLAAGHDGAHHNTECGGEYEEGHPCSADHHTTGCGMKCTLAVQGYNPDGTENGGATATGCTLTKGHTGNHDNPVCIKTDKCGATGAHVAPKAATAGTPAQGTEGEEGYVPAVPATPAVEGCPNYDGLCGVGGCDKQAGHSGNHNNAKCLGYNDDGKCGVAGDAEHPHIAGCSKYTCGCSHTHANFTTTLTCTHKAGCAYCNAWNAFVTKQNAKVAEYAKYTDWQTKKAAYEADQEKDPEAQEGIANPGPWVGAVPSDPGAAAVACTCKDCKPNPAMGAVVDAEGNEVDPADPTDPTEPEIPTKAEDFTDMEDWMAADVQVALDKGWMQGIGDGKFDGRAATTGTMVAAVLARMDGEEITGTTWAEDALAWAEGKDVFEGIELTGESMARKDLVLVIWRMANKPASDFELTFTDVDGLEGDHLTAMKWAAENGIVKGNGDDTVTPDGAVNRAALCAMLARYDGLEK